MNSLPFTARRTCLVLLALFVFSFWIACNRNPPPSPREINLAGASLRVGQAPDFVSRTYTFFVGSPTERFEMDLRLFGGTTNCPMSVVSGSGQVLQTITTGGPLTVQFPGNVGLLRFTSVAVGDVPSLNIDSIRIFPRSGAVGPGVPAGMTDNLPAMPLTLNSEVLLAFPGEPMTYFLVVQGVANRTLDIVLDSPDVNGAGTGTVLIRSDDFALSEESAEHTIQGNQGGFGRITVNPQRDTLFMTVRSQAVSGFARVSVNQVPNNGILSLSARFVNPLPSETDIAQLTAIVRVASHNLYMATAGRVRIAELAVFTSATAGGVATGTDVLITNVLDGTGSSGLPTGAIGLELGPDINTGGVTLAREILTHRFPLRSEPSANGNPLCPSSLLGSDVPALCWQRNHNPTGNAALAASHPSSAWGTISLVLNAVTPTSTPPQILDNTSSVIFPLNIVRIN